MAHALCKTGAPVAARGGGAPVAGRSSVRQPSAVGFALSARPSGPLKCGPSSWKALVGGSELRAVKDGVPAAPSQMKLVSFTSKWWEKGLQSNMKDITSANDLVDSLLNAGNKLVIIDFFSPGCGGCKALHPKICQFAETNPELLFLQVNYEEQKSLCYSLNVHVLPFFRFYRGAQGRLCSFSCTNATIKKFKDALAKYSAESCSLGPARGLEDSELLALAANKDLSFTYPGQPNNLVLPPGELVGPALAGAHPLPKSDRNAEDNAFVTAWR